MKNTKKCFGCKKTYPLIMYHVNTSKYMREADKGVTIECRFCILKRAKNDKGLMQRIEGKFEFVLMTKKEIIKYVLKR